MTNSIKDMIKLLSVIFVFTFICGCLADGFTKEVSVDPDSGNGIQGHNNISYCFRFTWLGPKYDKDSNIKNVTCEDLTKGEKGTPCRRPLVVSKNAGIPDTDWMWKKYPAGRIACRMTGVDACVKYTYKYNSKVENITYMCSKVRIDKEHGVKDGCYTQYNDGGEIEVCVCESRPGRLPCNAASNLQWNILAVAISALTVFLPMALLDSS